ASKANVLMIFAFGKFSLQAFNAVSRLGWKPQIFVNDVSSASALMAIVPQKAANGSISIVFGKDPASPQWATDKGVKLFQSILKKYGDGINSRDLKDGYFTTGMASAYTMVDTLRKAGKNLSRQGVMNAATHLTERGNPFLLPGIVIHTTPSSRFPLTQVRLQRWSGNARRRVPIGCVRDGEPVVAGRRNAEADGGVAEGKHARRGRDERLG